MARVAIGPPLRRYCGGKAELHGHGSTVLEVLRDISLNYPQLRARILKNDSEISSRVFIYREDDSIIHGDRETAAVQETDHLRIYVFVGGG